MKTNGEIWVYLGGPVDNQPEGVGVRESVWKRQFSRALMEMSGSGVLIRTVDPELLLQLWGNERNLTIDDLWLSEALRRDAWLHLQSYLHQCDLAVFHWVRDSVGTQMEINTCVQQGIPHFAWGVPEEVWSHSLALSQVNRAGDNPQEALHEFVMPSLERAVQSLTGR